MGLFTHILHFIRPIVVLSILLVALVCVNIAQSSAIAASGSPWKNGTPNIESADTITPQEYSEIRQYREGTNPRAECVNRNIKNRGIFGVIANKYLNTCWYNTSIGLISLDGRYILHEGDVAGELVTAAHTAHRSRLYPTANPDIFLEKVPKSGSTVDFWRFRHVSDLNFIRDESLLGEVRYDFANINGLELKNEKGEHLTPTQTSQWWSSDNRYLHVWTKKTYTLYRIDMQTFETLAVPLLDPKLVGNVVINGSAALSPSGRFAAVAVENGFVHSTLSNMFVVDYDSCTIESGQFVNIANDCEIATFKEALKAKVPNYYYPQLPRFYGEHTLGIYHRPYGSAGNFTQYLLQAPGTERKENNYVALGDSFSSGEGAGDYIEGTDILGTNMCHTSKNSYPYLINRQLNLDSFLSVACSGAVIPNVTYDPQWGKAGEEKYSTFPGETWQLRVIDNEPTNIVTMTMSGNDIGFSLKLGYCLVYGNDCFSTYSQRSMIVDEINRLHPKLINMYGQILRDSGPNPRLYVLGYPQLASNKNEVQCATNVQLNTYQRQMAHDLIEYFNAVIKNAAVEAGAYYVDAEEAFSGKKLCEGPSSTLAVNGLSLGNDLGIWKIRGLGSASFHPNEIGHELFKSLLIQQTDGFTKFPDPSTYTSFPNANEYAFMDVPSGTLGEIRTLYYNPKAEPTLLQRGAKALIEVSNPFIPAPPNEMFEAFLHSNPTYLGQVQTNGAGYIHAAVEVPESVQPGMHELHIKGKDLDGNPISIYEYVYVAVSASDFDGDGIPNENELCGIFNPSNLDQDQDGIDDACDPMISNSPESISSNKPINSDSSSEVISQMLGASIINPLQVANSTENKSDQNYAKVASASNSSVQKNPSSRIEYRERTNFLLLLASITLALIIGYSLYRYVKTKR